MSLKRIAKRSDWKNLPLPEARKAITISRRYSKAEFQKLTAGLIPLEMEDHWFIFYESPWLYMHRSYTGICIYQVRFEARGDEIILAEALVNRDMTQYGEERNVEDVWILSIWLDDLAGRPTEDLWQQYRAVKKRGYTEEELKL